jgi:hypothetical protein
MDDPASKKSTVGQQYLDVKALPLTQKAALEMKKRGLVHLPDVKTPPKYEGMTIVAPGVRHMGIALSSKGREELRKFNAAEAHTAALSSAMDRGVNIPTRVLLSSPEHMKRALMSYHPVAEKPYYGDLVESKSGLRGIMQGTSGYVAGQGSVVDPTGKNSQAEYVNMAELTKLMPLQSEKKQPVERVA